jgi:hypothetical protein
MMETSGMAVIPPARTTGVVAAAAVRATSDPIGDREGTGSAAACDVG